MDEQYCRALAEVVIGEAHAIYFDMLEIRHGGERPAPSLVRPPRRYSFRSSR
jgi:hypothetical protein